jgi:hypothetical protein
VRLLGVSMHNLVDPEEIEEPDLPLFDLLDDPECEDTARTDGSRHEDHQEH